MSAQWKCRCPHAPEQHRHADGCEVLGCQCTKIDLPTCPGCGNLLLGGQRVCSPDCAAAELERRADEEMVRVARVVTAVQAGVGEVPRQREVTPQAQVACRYCASYDLPEADEPQDACVDCTETRDRVCLEIRAAISDAKENAKDPRFSYDATADRIMRLFLSGGSR